MWIVVKKVANGDAQSQERMKKQSFLSEKAPILRPINNICASIFIYFDYEWKTCLKAFLYLFFIPCTITELGFCI